MSTTITSSTPIDALTEARHRSSISAGAEKVTTTAAITQRTVQWIAVTASTLVTGGAGYIGSHTVRALDQAGRRVVVLDSLELGSAAAVFDVPLVVGEIADEALVEQTCRDHDVDTIVHFAAYKNVGESMQQPSKYFHNNVDGTVRLLDAALRSGVQQIVFSSSCSVYGTPGGRAGRRDAADPPRIGVRRNESDRRARTALVRRGARPPEREPAVLQRGAGASFDSAIGEDWTYALNLVPVAIRALLTGDRELQVFGDDYPTPDGTCIRDYIHVDDLAQAHIAAIDYLAIRS